MRYTGVAVALGLALVGCGGEKGPVGVTSVTPSIGTTAGGTSVTIKGWGFSAGAAQVDFDTSAAGSISVVDDATITCNTPAHAAGYVDVTVTIGGTDSATRNNGFRYIVPPNITGVNPTEGPSGGGTSVTISGTGFQDGAEVLFDTLSAENVVVVNDTTITCETPAAGVAGAVEVTVINPDGGEDTSSGAFTYRLPPEISSISPAMFTVIAGGTLTITGTAFYGSTANTTVNLEGTAITVTSVTFSEIQATVPASLAVGYYDVEVVNPDGQSDSVDAAVFVYDDSNSLFVSTSGVDATGDGSFGNPYRTIGKGLTEADNQSKTLVVLSGTYDTESLPIAVPDGVTAYGADGTVSVDGGGTASAAFTFSSLSGTTLLAGFSICNLDDGTGTAVVHTDSADVTLLNFTIDDCRLGVEAQGGQLILDGTVLSNNEHGGVYIHGNGSLVMTDCEVNDNGFKSSGGSLGGLTATGSSVQLQVTDTEFTANTSVGRQVPLREAGGAAAVVLATGEFVRCTFRENEAKYGGAVYVRGVDWDNDTNRYRPLKFRNCLFVMNNSTLSPESTGSSVFLDAGDTQATDLRGVAFINCVFDSDVLRLSGGAVAAYIYEEGYIYQFLVQPVFTNCIFSNSSGSACHAVNVNHPDNAQVRGVFALFYCGFKGNAHCLSYANTNYRDSTGGVNDVKTVPVNGELTNNVGNLVLDASDTLYEGDNDYHLDTSSPCIDAGHPDAAYNDLDASRNDMGIYGGPDAGS